MRFWLEQVKDFIENAPKVPGKVEVTDTIEDPINESIEALEEESNVKHSLKTHLI